MSHWNPSRTLPPPVHHLLPANRGHDTARREDLLPANLFSFISNHDNRCRLMSVVLRRALHSQSSAESLGIQNIRPTWLLTSDVADIRKLNLLSDCTFESLVLVQMTHSNLASNIPDPIHLNKSLYDYTAGTDWKLTYIVLKSHSKMTCQDALCQIWTHDFWELW